MHTRIQYVRVSHIDFHLNQIDTHNKRVEHAKEDAYNFPLT